MLWLAYRIPNLRPGILFSLFAIPQMANSSGAVPWNNFVHFGVTLATGMFVFSRGWFVGGDAQLYAATALGFGANGVVPLLLCTTISGALLALLFIVTRLTGLRKNVPRDDRRIPYGVAITFGGVFTAAYLGSSSMVANLG